jgi:ubiquinone/menaquinone biosynthesis C-methylase UbiE
MVIGIIAAVVLVIVVLVLLNREIYYYDGIHLGRKIQGKLYSRWAAKYDSDKKKSQANDEALLIQPIIQKLSAENADLSQVSVLDLATGTGRLPFALLQHAEFTGQVVGLDISLGMLSKAAAKLAPRQSQVHFLQHTALSLPFPDNTFDVVSCVEALECMPDIQQVMNEMARVLRPGGLLVTSRCTKKWGYEFNLRSQDDYRALLQTAGFEQIGMFPWWEWFDRIFARKPGSFSPVQPTALTEVLKCPQCEKIAWAETDAAGYCCKECGKGIKISPEGVVIYSE